MTTHDTHRIEETQCFDNHFELQFYQGNHAESRMLILSFFLSLETLQKTLNIYEFMFSHLETKVTMSVLPASYGFYRRHNNMFKRSCEKLCKCHGLLKNSIYNNIQISEYLSEVSISAYTSQLDKLSNGHDSSL